MNRIVAVIILIILIALNIPMVAHAKGQESPLKDSTRAYCEEVGKELGIAPEFLMAVIEFESGGKAHATNGNCKGLMQINANYHKERMKRLGVKDLYDEESNIRVGADYLLELMEKYEDAAYALDVYNGNSNAYYNYHHGIISDYADKILTRTQELEKE